MQTLPKPLPSTHEPGNAPQKRSSPIRTLAFAIAIAAPLASHLALALGHGYGIAIALTALQALALGALVWSTLPNWRALGPLATTLILAALALGARHTPEIALLAAAGATHAILYTGLLAAFLFTLRPGRTSLVTTLASRINPRFHPGMIPYTRAVTTAWCLFFAAQLIVSATLLATAPALWPPFVTTLHLPAILLMALLESLVRRWRWRHEHPLSFTETVQGVRRLLAQPRA